MQLSVIIVNYQVKYFLELCLHSAEKALRGLDAEVIVVDNHSADDSLAYLRPRFPRVQFLANEENLGFARANNQALKQARGEVILFLNPDTILPEDIATKCLAFLAATPRIGGLGVRMIDGSGHFLKESRRGFPTPWVGFCRLSGLAALFPRSRAFSGYYLGHLPIDTAHPAPVLSGACLWMRRAILDEIGAFDEQFFLYAEDIDLSYRIEQAGYTNYYNPAVTIIHFKGESTRKDIRYVRQFYRAMRQFRQKHFNKGLPAFFNLGIQGAIQMRAGLAGIGRLLRRDRQAPNDQQPSPNECKPPSNGTRPSPNGDNPAISPNSPTRIRVAGDPMEAARVRSILAARGATFAEDGQAEGDDQKAGDLLLCEGAGFSFRDGIAQLESIGRETMGRRISGRAGIRRVWFHAEKSDSAVGSPDRKDQGDVWVL